MRAALSISLSLLAAPVSAEKRDAGWREVATAEDRGRLRSWRDAWMKALPAARAGGGASVIAGDPALFDPDRTLRDPVPPAGMYRCRTYKLGAQGPAGLDWVAYPWFRCRVGQDGDGFVAGDGAGDAGPRCAGAAQGL